MDQNEFEGKGKEIRSQSKIWWRRITDSDLYEVESAEIKYFEFVTRLQLRDELGSEGNQGNYRQRSMKPTYTPSQHDSVSIPFLSRTGQTFSTDD